MTHYIVPGVKTPRVKGSILICTVINCPFKKGWSVLWGQHGNRVGVAGHTAYRFYIPNLSNLSRLYELLKLSFFIFSLVTCLYVHHMSQKRVSDALELGFQMIVSHRGGTGNRTWVP